MSSTDSALLPAAACTNVADCATARAGETLVWYRGAGEYCPECGEALTNVGARTQMPSALMTPPEAAPARAPEPAPVSTSTSTSNGAESAPAAHAAAPPNVFARIAFLPPPPDFAPPKVPPELRGRATPAGLPLRRVWFAAGISLAIVAIVAAAAFYYYYSPRPVAATDGVPADVIAVCTIPSAQQLAAALVAAYAAKSAIAASRFQITSGTSCGVSFTTAPETPDAVIARDGIVAIVNPLNPIAHVSEQQLRAIYSGSIRDWSQLGGPRGRIVPLLPDATSDEAKSLAATLLLGVSIDRTVRRSGSSADVTRMVTGADRTSRGAIGLVAFSGAVPARVVPLAYLPPPSVLTISTHHYPYTFSIAVQPGSAQISPAAQALIDYARSSEGAAIVAKSGLIPRAGF